MDNINFVTSSIIKDCQSKNVAVSETLAAFMARARVLEDQKLYHMTKTLSDEDVTALIEKCSHHLESGEDPPKEVCKESENDEMPSYFGVPILDIRS